MSDICLSLYRLLLTIIYIDYVCTFSVKHIKIFVAYLFVALCPRPLVRTKQRGICRFVCTVVKILNPLQYYNINTLTSN